MLQVNNLNFLINDILSYEVRNLTEIKTKMKIVDVPTDDNQHLHPTFTLINFEPSSAPLGIFNALETKGLIALRDKVPNLQPNMNVMCPLQLQCHLSQVSTATPIGCGKSLGGSCSLRCLWSGSSAAKQCLPFWRAPQTAHPCCSYSL